jgi:RNA polymerase sigma-70 factor (ECF subfamily)
MAEGPNTRDFLREFSRHSRRIYGFIRALVPNQADAEEIYQDVCTVLWEKFGEFQPGTDFRAWGFQIAHYRVLSFRQRQGRSQLTFSEAFIDAVEADLTSADFSEQLDLRLRALADCYAKLPKHDRAMVDRRYVRGESVKLIAEQTRRGLDYVYKALRRIHQSLFDCVTRSVADSGLGEDRS